MSEEKEYGEADETGAESSAIAALDRFDDALLVLPSVDNPALYKIVDNAFPHRGKTWRNDKLPRDAFIVACNGHITRINQGLTRYGINKNERSLAELRKQVFKKAIEIYMEKQRGALVSTPVSPTGN
jgi:hypothetical protein